jgi:hypothetical protein
MGVARVYARCHPLFARERARKPAYVAVYALVHTNPHISPIAAMARNLPPPYRNAKKT